MNIGRSEKVKNDHLEELEQLPPLQEQGGDGKKRKHGQVEEPGLPSGLNGLMAAAGFDLTR
jgi:hypothetical protein